MENIFLYIIIGYIQFNWVVLTSVLWSRRGQGIDLLKSLKAIGVGTLLWPIVTLLYGWGILSHIHETGWLKLRAYGILVIPVYLVYDYIRAKFYRCRSSTRK